MYPKKSLEVIPTTEDIQPPQEALMDTARNAGATAVDSQVALQNIAHDTEPSSESEPFVITLDFTGLLPAQVDGLIAEKVRASTIRPHLVLPEEIHAPWAYNRLQEQKDHYRELLRGNLVAAWKAEHGTVESEKILGYFDQLSSVVREEGAVVFGDLISRESFGQLVAAYDGLMQKDGSVSLLHSYANLRNQPEFLANPDFNGAFFHPLAIALISERVGGAVRVVDARAKDAGPISVKAQDNMLHIDNTPYRDEYKILVTWEKGKASGPKGQNFVFLPGTHRGVRDSFVNPDSGEVYSTENASIFVHAEDVDQVFALQEQVRSEGNAVVEIHDEERPLTTVFPSGSLVHHRLRTEAGHSRSGLIIPFHRTGDTPGQFIGDYPLGTGRELEESLFGFQNADSDQHFCQIMVGCAAEIAEKLKEIFEVSGQTTLIDTHAKTLTPADMQEWYKIATDAPTVEDIKRKADYFPLGSELSIEDLLDLLGRKMMIHDKHGPIDMILYADGREEPRKWARNRIREMREDILLTRLSEWSDQIGQPSTNDLLTIDQLRGITERLAAIVEGVPLEVRKKGCLDPIEGISPQEAYCSVGQLIVDLGENLTRADDRQTYLSASLFQFWACDELNRLQGASDPRLKEFGGQLLRNYIAIAILIEKQIANE